MNGILGLTELLLGTDLDRQQRAWIGMVKSAADSLLSVVNDVLDFSKMEAGRLALDPRPFDVRDLVCGTLQTLAPAARQKGLQLAARIHPEVPATIEADPDRLRQVLLNLAGNAIKFTREGRVEISVSQEGYDLVYRVSDTGIGIPEKELENVFGEFRQVDATVTREYGGTGLGLSITKKFVELHGGRIGVESRLGKGSMFWFSIPLEVDKAS
jgi:signal transduction histidine kinase